MSNPMSLQTLQRQNAYEEGVHVRIGEKLTGRFSKEIYRAEWLSADPTAIVILKMKGVQAVAEALLYMTLEHVNVIKTYGLVKPKTQKPAPDFILLLQEYAQDGSLERLLSERYFIPSEPVLLEIFSQVCSAMIYLAAHNVIHGDLGCRNVLVFKSDASNPKKNVVKLIDFGLAQDQSESSTADIEIPIRYAAAEIIRSSGRSGYSQQSDVYSFAVFLWEAYSSAKIPYGSTADDNEVAKRKLRGERLSRPAKCLSAVWKLMLECWNDRPEDRPTFQSIHTQLKAIQQQQAISSVASLLASMTDSNERILPSFIPLHAFAGHPDPQSLDHALHRDTHSNPGGTMPVNGEENQGTSFLDSSITMEQPARAILNETISLARSEEVEFGSCAFCHTPVRIDELNIHEESCGENRRSKPPPRKSSLPSGKSPSRIDPVLHFQADRNQNLRDIRRHQSLVAISDPVTRDKGPTSYPSKDDNHSIARIPCEICKRPVDSTQLKQHQRECIKQDKRRVEEKRKKIEQEANNAPTACYFCDRRFPIADLDNHENHCKMNPRNVVSQPSTPSATRSRSSFEPPTASTKLRPSGFDRRIQRAGETESRSRATRNPDRKQATKQKAEEPTGLRKIFTRLFRFTKK